MKKKAFMSSIVLLAIVALSVTVVFGADMFSGTWKVNSEKTVTSGPPAKGPSIQKLEAVENGIMLAGDFVTANSQKVHQEFTVKFDGKDYPFKSMLDGKPSTSTNDTISAKKIDDYTLEFTIKLNTAVTVARNVISKDGKTRTVTQTGTTAQGQAVNNTIVYEKQ
jgi:hypothetical protein